MRILTKEERLKARYIPEGYTVLLESKDGIVYAKGNTGIAYKGTAFKSSWHTTFNNVDNLKRESEVFLKNLEDNRLWREERRATRSKGETDTQRVKKALKAAGYNVISVTRGRGTAYNWIEITIDDYRSIIDDNGNMTDRYGDVMQIAKLASGRQDLEDDISTDLFMVNISVNFKKYHTCSECIVSNCDKYHTPDMGVCGGFVNQAMNEKKKKEHEEYLEEQKRLEKEPIKVTYNPITGTVALQNMVVNIGARFTITEDGYNNLVSQGKTNSQIFDHLAYEDTLERKAKEYAKECELNREKLGHPWIYDGSGNRNNIAGWDPNYREKGPHGVKEIIITRAEGSSYLCGIPKYFNSFQSASNWLKSQAYSFPKTGGYDKHDFKIVFIDGETYSGRLDCKHFTCSDNDLDLFNHVSSFMRYMAKNETIQEEERARYQNFISQYLSLAEVV